MGDTGSGPARGGSKIKASTEASRRRTSVPDAVQTFRYPSGGSVTVPVSRRAEANSKNNRKILAKELWTARCLAQHGYTVEFTERGASNHDIFLNGIPAELKKVDSHKQIRYHAKHATEKQHAQIVAFDFQRETREIYGELKHISSKGIHGLAIFRDSQKIHKF